MKPRLQMLVTLPTTVVAIYCLLGDVGLVTFIKKVGATYLFFTALAFTLGALWDAAAPPRDIAAKKPAGGGTTRDEAGERNSPAAPKRVSAEVSE